MHIQDTSVPVSLSSLATAAAALRFSIYTTKIEGNHLSRCLEALGEIETSIAMASYPANDGVWDEEGTPREYTRDDLDALHERDGN